MTPEETALLQLLDTTLTDNLKLTTLLLGFMTEDELDHMLGLL